MFLKIFCLIKFKNNRIIYYFEIIFIVIEKWYILVYNLKCLVINNKNELLYTLELFFLFPNIYWYIYIYIYIYISACRYWCVLQWDKNVLHVSRAKRNKWPYRIGMGSVNTVQIRYGTHDSQPRTFCGSGCTVRTVSVRYRQNTDALSIRYWYGTVLQAEILAIEIFEKWRRRARWVFFISFS